MFNELVIIDVPIKKIRPFLAFMEEVHLLQTQNVLQEGKTFHYIVLGKLYRNNELKDTLKTFNVFKKQATKVYEVISFDM